MSCFLLLLLLLMHRNNLTLYMFDLIVANEIRIIAFSNLTFKNISQYLVNLYSNRKQLKF